MGNTWSTLQSNWETETRFWNHIPVSYTNKLKDNMDQLIKVIDEARLPASVYWDFEEGKGKNEFIFIEILPSELIARMSGAVVRSYPFQINYYMTITGGTKLKVLDALSRRVNKLERALENNNHRTDSGTYYWHDGEVLEIDLDAPLEDYEDLLNLHVGRLTYTVTTMEDL